MDDLQRRYNLRNRRLRRLRRDLLWLSRQKYGLLSMIASVLAKEVLTML